MNTRDLGGHSGCRILLCEDEQGAAFVRKISSTHAYNARLQVQARKQAEYNGNAIRTPRVIREGLLEDGLFYFDMEYVRGITLAEYMKHIEIDKIRGLVEQIMEYILAEAARQTTAAPQIFQDKLSSLQTKFVHEDNRVIHEAMSLLVQHDWSAVPQSACHGDMTLENIIVKGDRLYFIDFLDSFYNSWVLDLSTLLQDAQSLWSYRFMQPMDINTVIRLMIFRDILMDAVHEHWHGQADREVYFALLLKLMRIFPYTKDKLTYDFLTNKTISVMRCLERSAQ